MFSTISVSSLTDVSTINNTPVSAFNSNKFSTLSVSSLSVALINGAAYAPASQWSLYPPVQNVQLGTSSINISPTTFGYVNSYLDTNLFIGKKSYLFFPDVIIYPRDFQIGDLLSPATTFSVACANTIELNALLGVTITGVTGVSVLGGGGVSVQGGGEVTIAGGGGLVLVGGGGILGLGATITLGAGEVSVLGGLINLGSGSIQIGSGLLNILSGNIAIASGAIELGTGAIVLGTGTTPGGGMDIYGGNLTFYGAAGNSAGIVMLEGGKLSTNYINATDPNALAITGLSSINGFPYVPNAGNLSSLANWADFPAVSTIDVDGFDVTNVLNVSTVGIQTSSIATDHIFSPTPFGNLAITGLSSINGFPYTAIPPSSISSVAEWADFPAVATIDADGNDLINVVTISSITVNAPYILTTSIIGNSTLQITGLSSVNGLPYLAATPPTTWAQYPANSTIQLVGNALIGASLISTIDLNVNAIKALNEVLSGGMSASTFYGSTLAVNAATMNNLNINILLSTPSANVAAIISLSSINGAPYVAGGVPTNWANYVASSTVQASTANISSLFTNSISTASISTAALAISSINGAPYVAGGVPTNWAQYPANNSTVNINNNSIVNVSTLQAQAVIGGAISSLLASFSTLAVEGNTTVRGTATVSTLNTTSISTASISTASLAISSINGAPYIIGTNVSSLTQWAIYPAVSTVQADTALISSLTVGQSGIFVKGANPNNAPIPNGGIFLQEDTYGSGIIYFPTPGHSTFITDILEMNGASVWNPNETSTINAVTIDNYTSNISNLQPLACSQILLNSVGTASQSSLYATVSIGADPLTASILFPYSSIKGVSTVNGSIYASGTQWATYPAVSTVQASTALISSLTVGQSGIFVKGANPNNAPIPNGGIFLQEDTYGSGIIYFPTPGHSTFITDILEMNGASVWNPNETSTINAVTIDNYTSNISNLQPLACSQILLNSVGTASQSSLYATVSIGADPLTASILFPYSSIKGVSTINGNPLSLFQNSNIFSTISVSSITNVSTVNGNHLPWTSTLGVGAFNSSITGNTAGTPILLYSSISFPYPGQYSLFQKALIVKVTGGSGQDVHANMLYDGGAPDINNVQEGIATLPFVNNIALSSFTTLTTSFYVSSTALNKSIYYFDYGAANYTAKVYASNPIIQYLPPP